MSPSEKHVDRTPSKRGGRVKAGAANVGADAARSPRASGARAARSPHDDQRNPAWFKPVMFGFMIVGFLWVIVYYISQTTLPLPQLGTWNIVIGFGIMFIGFLMTTRWK